MGAQVNKPYLFIVIPAMMKYAVIIVFLVTTSFTNAKLVKTKVTDDITVSLPTEMFPMTPDDVAQRYPSVRAPLGAFTNQDRVVDFSVNISATNWPDGDAVMAQEFFKASLYNLYDRLEPIDEGTHLLKKKKFFFFEFESRISGDRRKQGFSDPVLRYTYIQYLVEPDRTLVFTFSCPKDLREDWQTTAREIMKSVRVR
ncbi:MAG: hypothetical protein K2U26_09085 [Cyclobacteriaceae bacterium]|nr:hypothetical protein [Cyclobacteriaceae bacterium]